MKLTFDETFKEIRDTNNMLYRVTGNNFYRRIKTGQYAERVMEIMCDFDFKSIVDLTYDNDKSRYREPDLSRNGFRVGVKRFTNSGEIILHTKGGCNDWNYPHYLVDMDTDEITTVNVHGIYVLTPRKMRELAGRGLMVKENVLFVPKNELVNKLDNYNCTL